MTTPERRALLTPALGFLTIEWHGEAPAAATALHCYMDNWRGADGVVDALRAEGFAVNVSTARARFSLGVNASAGAVGTLT